MSDYVKNYIYQEHIRVKHVVIEDAIEEICNMQQFDKTDKMLFTPAALFAAAYASEQKNDSGSAYVSYKYPKQNRSYTAICETDGRIRGYQESYTPPDSNAENILLIAGVKLAARGDYQSAVMAQDVEAATQAFFNNSSQTEAALRFGSNELLWVEYLPGHGNAASDAQRQKIRKELSDVIKDVRASEMKFLSELPISFGCTCSKRKIKQTIDTAQIKNLEFPLEVTCKFCGKKYSITEIS